MNCDAAVRETATACRSRHEYIGADLDGHDFEDANLCHADLRGARLFGVRLRRTDLRGAVFDMTGIVEIWIPKDLDINLVNQIRAYDFQSAAPRHVEAPPPGATLACPYRRAPMKPVFYHWGSKTWNGGRGWKRPSRLWSAEEIISAVLTALGCRHDLAPPGPENGDYESPSAAATRRSILDVSVVTGAVRESR